AKALLQLGTAMENGVVYNLLVRNIQDLNENTMADTSVLISYYEAQTNDVVINEIMADPSPVVGLPEWEFVELYNNTNIPINLEGWKLMIGTGERIMGAVSIQPKDFLLLGHENSSQELSTYGNFFGFSSFQLANSGASLSLLGKQGQMV
ncbi:lamin tail domain-containing protein, partial [Arthrospira platensis SPKY1]|nr:lamin tail domain-containing protein [Arthrospira platensis SPKY1]